MGEGGGWGEPGRGLGATSDSVAGTESTVGLEPPDLALPEDFCDMDLSRSPLVTSAAENELLGLSDFAPGILERKPRNERDDSLVSDLLNEGYDCNVSLPDLSRDVDEAFLGVLEPSLDFEGCWPILPSADRKSWVVDRRRRDAIGECFLCIALLSQRFEECRQTGLSWPFLEDDNSSLKAPPQLCDCLSSVVYVVSWYGTDRVKEA